MVILLVTLTCEILLVSYLSTIVEDRIVLFFLVCLHTMLIFPSSPYSLISENQNTLVARRSILILKDFPRFHHTQKHLHHTQKHLDRWTLFRTANQARSCVAKKATISWTVGATIKVGLSSLLSCDQTDRILEWGLGRSQAILTESEIICRNPVLFYIWVGK